jgi:uncharacterized protein YbjQ (UPF0145 family)
VTGSRRSLIVSTTREVEGHTVNAYLGIVSGEATVRVSGGGTRKGSYDRSARTETLVHCARDQALENMQRQAADIGADAIIGIAIDSSSLPRPQGGTLVIIVASGTAVTLDPDRR